MSYIGRHVPHGDTARRSVVNQRNIIVDGVAMIIIIGGYLIHLCVQQK